MRERGDGRVLLLELGVDGLRPVIMLIEAVDAEWIFSRGLRIRGSEDIIPVTLT